MSEEKTWCGKRAIHDRSLYVISGPTDGGRGVAGRNGRAGEGGVAGRGGAAPAGRHDGAADRWPCVTWLAYRRRRPLPTGWPWRAVGRASMWPAPREDGQAPVPAPRQRRLTPPRQLLEHRRNEDADGLNVAQRFIRNKLCPSIGKIGLHFSGDNVINWLGTFPLHGKPIPANFVMHLPCKLFT